MPEENKIKKEDPKVELDTSGPEVDVAIPEEKTEEIVETKEEETVKEVQEEVKEEVKEEPKETEVFEILGLPDSVWVADSQKYKVLYYFIESLDDYNSVEIDITSKKVNGFDWD